MKAFQQNPGDDFVVVYGFFTLLTTIKLPCRLHSRVYLCECSVAKSRQSMNVPAVNEIFQNSLLRFSCLTEESALSILVSARATTRACSPPSPGTLASSLTHDRTLKHLAQTDSMTRTVALLYIRNPLIGLKWFLIFRSWWIFSSSGIEGSLKERTIGCGRKRDTIAYSLGPMRRRHSCLIVRCINAATPITRKYSCSTHSLPTPAKAFWSHPTTIATSGTLNSGFSMMTQTHAGVSPLLASFSLPRPASTHLKTLEHPNKLALAHALISFWYRLRTIPRRYC